MPANPSHKKTSSKNTILILRGRKFSKRQIATIQTVVRKYSHWGRWRVSLKVCEKLNWFQPNGWPKDRACRDVLLQMNKRGIIELPALRPDYGSIARGKDPVKKYYSDSPFVPEVCRKGEFVATLAKGDAQEKVWNETIRRYHYLGHKIVVGRNLKFLIHRNEDLVAAFSLSEASYNV